MQPAVPALCLPLAHLHAQHIFSPVAPDMQMPAQGHHAIQGGLPPPSSGTGDAGDQPCPGSSGQRVGKGGSEHPPSLSKEPLELRACWSPCPLPSIHLSILAAASS